MNGDDGFTADDRRGISRRTEALEHQCNKLEMRVTVLEVKVDGLIATMKSNFDAMGKGQDLIMAKLSTLVPETALLSFKTDIEKLSRRLTPIEELKLRAVGALTLLAVLGVSGVIGGVIAIVKALKGP